MPRVRRRFKTIDAPLNRIQTLILSRRYYHYACELLQGALDLRNTMIDILQFDPHAVVCTENSIRRRRREQTE